MLLLRAENNRFADELLSTPSNQSQQFLKKLGAESNVALLLRYQTAEQNRRYTETWELAQLGLGFLLAACLFFGTQRRMLPLALCALMLVTVAFAHFTVTPEVALRGRGTDFPPGNATPELVRRVRVLSELYGWLEGLKLALGGVLAGYLFVFRVRRSRRQTDIVERGQHNHVEIGKSRSSAG